MRNSLRIVLMLALVLLAVTARAQNFTATIDAAQETPPNASPATGSATLVLDTAANTLSYNIMYSGLVATETAAHIHGFAPPGMPAGVLHPLPAGNPKIGVWNYSEAQEANIIAGLTYINIHTMSFPGGEIRGQIVEDTASDAAGAPRVASLQAASPTSVRRGVWVVFALPRAGRASLAIYSVDGRLRRTLHEGVQPSGMHRILWDGRDHSGQNVAPGVYFVQFGLDEHTFSQKLVLTR